MRSISMIVVLGSAFVLSAPASAQQAPSANVTTRDLDLSTPRDVTILNRRIATAVVNVCPGVATGLLLPTEVLLCRRHAASQAGQQVAAIVARDTGRLASR